MFFKGETFDASLIYPPAGENTNDNNIEEVHGIRLNIKFLGDAQYTKSIYALLCGSIV